jgi:CheY-like chemotaxis protein
MSPCTPDTDGFPELRILVVEDEALVAMLLEDMLRRLGCVVVGPAPSVDAATDIAGRAVFDLALLDLNLRGEVVFPVAEILVKRDIPFVFVTGYGDLQLPFPLARRPTLAKPFDLKRLEEAIRRGIGERPKDGA